MNDKLDKTLESLKRHKSEIQEIKSYTEKMGNTSGQCEDKISELEDNDAFKNQLPRISGSMVEW